MVFELFSLLFVYISLLFGGKREKVAERQFDFIIVGGGTAGLVLAERLSSNENIQVGAIEAGSYSERDITLVPFLYPAFMFNPEIDWGFTTTPQRHAGNQVFYLPRGKVLGGGSAINGMVFARASEHEYDAWEQLGNPGWNWQTVNINIKTIENFTPAPPEIAEENVAEDLIVNHGSDGPINVTYSNYYAPDGLVGSFVRTMEALGVPTNRAAAGGDTVGVYQTPSAVDHVNRTRSYAANAFYKPNTQRPNLVVLTNAEVTALDIEKNSTELARASSVLFKYENKTHSWSLSATGSIVLTAGTYQTPKILEHSGIGDSSILTEVGVTPIVDLPGVGENLQDHTNLLLTYELRPGIYPSADAVGTDEAFRLHQWDSYIKNRTGIYASTHGSTVAFLTLGNFTSSETAKKLKDGLDQELKGYENTSLAPQLAIQRALLDDETVPQIELMMFPTIANPLIKAEPNTSYLTFGVVALRPFSRGNVHISKSDPTAYPTIDHKFLSFDFDAHVMAQAAKFVAESVVATPPFSNMIERRLVPEQEFDTDLEWEAWLRNNLISAWHPCGSASMLPLEQNGVVDVNLTVYGTSNIKVADASIIPLEIGTHTMATVYGNAIQAAKIFTL